MEYIGSENGFCAATAGLWQFMGTILMIFKIIIPALLIIIGIITLGKAVISDDDKEMKNGCKKLITKFIVAVCIFFIPTIVTALFGVVTGFDDVRDDYTVCKKCIINPKNSECLSNIVFIDAGD